VAVVSSVVPPAVQAWQAATGYTIQAPNDQGDPSDWGVPHPPSPDTEVVQPMPAGETSNPFAEGLGFYGFESQTAVTDQTPGPVMAGGGIAMSSGTDWPAWDQAAGTRHQADTGGPARTYRELLPDAGIERGSNVRTMSTDNLSTRRPDGSFDSVPNGHLANDISIRNVVPDLGIHGRVPYSERPVWLNVAVPPAAALEAPAGVNTPMDVNPWLSVQPSAVQTVYQDVPDPAVAPGPVMADTAYNPYEAY
jgi:hypothetical protein